MNCTAEVLYPPTGQDTAPEVNFTFEGEIGENLDEEGNTFYQRHKTVRIGERYGNPLQYFCLENPTDGGAWWAAIYGVSQSWTQLKRFSSNSSSSSRGFFIYIRTEKSTCLGIVISICQWYL